MGSRLRPLIMPWFLVAYAVALPTFGQGDSAGPESPRKMRYQDFLIEAGDRLACYFTVERMAFSPDRPSAFDRLELVPEDVATIEALVEKLRKDLKGITVIRRQSKLAQEEPVVIHLIETSLVEWKDYPLDQKIDLKITGTVYKLLQKLKRMRGDVGPVTGAGIPILPVDCQTQTRIDADDGTIRAILTDAVLRDGYSRTLWEANAYDEARCVEVRFKGPIDWDTWDWDAAPVAGKE